MNVLWVISQTHNHSSDDKNEAKHDSETSVTGASDLTVFL